MSKDPAKTPDQNAARATPEPPKNGWTESYEWTPAPSGQDGSRSSFHSSCHLGFGRARD